MRFAASKSSSSGSTSALLHVGDAGGARGNRAPEEAGEENHRHDIGQSLHGLNRNLAQSGERHALEPDRGGVEEPEQEAGAERRKRAPAREDQGRERDEALAGGHVGDEAGRQRDRQVDAAKAAQHAADQDRRIAQPGDGDAGGVDRGRVLADRPQAQAEAGLCHDEGGERHRRERHVYEERVAEEEIGNARRGVERGRAPALAVPGMTEHGRQSGGEHVEGDPGDDLVAALADAGEAVQEGEGKRGNDRSRKPRSGGPEGARRRRRREGRGQHLAFKPDIDDAGALGPQPRKAGKKQRDRQPQGRIGERQKGGRVHSQLAAGRAAAITRATRPRKSRSRAPTNSTTMPPMTTTMSRVMRGCSKASSAPPWYSMPKSSEARTIPAGWARPMRATAIPTKP